MAVAEFLSQFLDQLSFRSMEVICINMAPIALIYLEGFLTFDWT